MDIKIPEGFEEHQLEARIIDIKQANKFALWGMIPAFILYFIPYFLIWGGLDFSNNWGLSSIYTIILYPLITIGALFGGIVLHELIHGIFWSFYAKKGFKSIKFGVLKESNTPYCHCKEPLKVKHYIIGGIMPAILLGFIPGFLAIYWGHSALLLFGFFFTIAAMGDFMIINMIRKEPASNWVLDHPSEAGYFIFKKDLPNS